jgi:stalled ribosome alternative rescue factor ArfA
MGRRRRQKEMDLFTERIESKAKGKNHHRRRELDRDW